MNIFAIISLCSFIICILLSIIVYFKQVRKTFNNELGKIFVFLCFSLAICWASIEFGYRQAEEFSTAYFWLKINFSWYIIISFLLHFVLLFTEHYSLLKRKLIYILIYGPSVIFILIDLTTNYLVTEPVLEQWGWTYGIPEFPLAHTISSTWAAFTGVFCLYICLNYHQNIVNSKKKKRAKFVVMGLLIPVGIAFNTEWLFPLIGIKSPELFVPAATIALVLIWYFVWINDEIEMKKRYKNVNMQVEKIIRKKSDGIINNTSHSNPF